MLLTMQHELLRVLYPVFIHCFMDLIAKSHLQEGIHIITHTYTYLEFSYLQPMPLILLKKLGFHFSARAFFNNFREDHEMMHSRDLTKLEGVLSPSHLEVNYQNTPKLINFISLYRNKLL